MEPNIMAQIFGADYQDTLNLITVSEAEAKHEFIIEHKEWCQLLTQMQEGDELYEYRTSPNSWKNRAGREGLRLVRNGKAIGGFCTSMN